MEYTPRNPATKFQSTLPMRGVTPRTHGAPASEKFQSTLPMRGVTLSPKTFHAALTFQSTLPMRGVTALTPTSAPARCISIHTPHAGSD